MSEKKTEAANVYLIKNNKGEGGGGGGGEEKKKGGGGGVSLSQAVGRTGRSYMGV